MNANLNDFEVTRKSPRVLFPYLALTVIIDIDRCSSNLQAAA